MFFIVLNFIYAIKSKGLQLKRVKRVDFIFKFYQEI